MVRASWRVRIICMRHQHRPCATRATYDSSIERKEIRLNMKISRYRPFKACELSVGDQTLMNLQFAPRTRYVWSLLPSSYNTPTHGQTNETTLRAAHVLHFSGDVKPWLRSNKARSTPGAKLWLESVCGALAH